MAVPVLPEQALVSSGRGAKHRTRHSSPETEATESLVRESFEKFGFAVVEAASKKSFLSTAES
jgi:hypothetical protein